MILSFLFYFCIIIIIPQIKKQVLFFAEMEEDTMENFGAVLKDIRISKNFRLKDLACDKISESTISRFENGITKLSI